MNKHDYYFKQLLTEAELDEGFDKVEEAILDQQAKSGVSGIVSGLVVSPHAPTPDLSVDISAGTAYDNQGRRIVNNTLFVLDCTKDYQNQPVTLGVGQEVWLLIVAEYEIDLDTPRTDGLSNTVYFDKSDSCIFKVIKGIAANIGLAVKPNPAANQVLLADVKRTHGDNDISSLDILTTSGVGRTAQAFYLTNAGNTLRRYNVKDAIYDILGMLSVISGSGVTFSGTTYWHDDNVLPGLSSTNVQNAINEIVNDLAVTSGNGGADKIGIAAISDSPHSLIAGSVYDDFVSLLGIVNNYINDVAGQVGDGGGGLVGVGERYDLINSIGHQEPLIPNPPTTVFDAFQELILDISANNSQGPASLLGLRSSARGDGATHIGADSAGSLNSGSVRKQLNQLDTEWGKLDRAQEWSATQTFDLGGIGLNAIFAQDTESRGVSHFDEGNDAYVAIGELNSSPITDSKKLLYVQYVTNVNKIRVYAGQGGTIEITRNAEWQEGSGNWNKASASESYMIRLDMFDGRITQLKDPSVAAGAIAGSDSAWSERSYFERAAPVRINEGTVVVPFALSFNAALIGEKQYIAIQFPVNFLTAPTVGNCTISSPLPSFPDSNVQAVTVEDCYTNGLLLSVESSAAAFVRATGTVTITLP